MENELKPCPFCGGTDFRIDKCVSKITCKNCFAKNPSIENFLKDGISKEDAMYLSWNTRYENGKQTPAV